MGRLVWCGLEIRLEVVVKGARSRNLDNFSTNQIVIELTKMSK